MIVVLEPLMLSETSIQVLIFFKNVAYSLNFVQDIKLLTYFEELIDHYMTHSLGTLGIVLSSLALKLMHVQQKILLY